MGGAGDGDVRVGVGEAHPVGGQGVEALDRLLGPRPEKGQEPPKDLNWDLWLGTAPVRPYAPGYHPTVWRAWQDFGTGWSGDIGCGAQYFSQQSVARLAPVSNIVGIKEATGKLDRGRQILELCGDQLDLYSGDDATAMELILLGAKGDISVTANVAPRAMHEMCAAALAGDRPRAEQIDQTLRALHRDLFIESSPIPVKWALHEMGMIPPGLRLPLTPLAPQHHDQVRAALRQAGVL